MNEVLPPYYYLDNFRFLIQWVRDRYADIMSEQELDFVASFLRLDTDSQCLLVRMISRKGPWFRLDKLVYAEIEHPAAAAEQLLDAGLVSSDRLLSVNELAQLLTKAELLELFRKPLASCKAARKDVLVATLNALFAEGQAWSQWTAESMGKLYRLEVQDTVGTLLLLFFGNAYQDLSEFVLQDLGLFMYEQYTIDQQYRLFNCRDDILHYQRLIDLREQLATADNLDALQQLVLQLPGPLVNPVMERRRGRLLNQVAYELERHGQCDLALQLYRQTSLSPSRERQIRLLEKSADYPRAWQLLITLQDNPASEHELQIAQRMAPRLAKKIGLSIAKSAKRNLLEQKIILPQMKDDAGNFLKVEEIARRHFTSDLAPCVYAENQLLNSLFGLWLWPEMFRSIKGAFANPFQAAPLDLYQEDFQQRRPGLEQLWQLLTDQNHSLHIQSMWQQKQGIANHFVSWQFIDETLLQLALQCIPAQHLRLIFQRLLLDLKANRSGLPDLIQFFPASNSYRMIEIKGPGDRIQDNQQRWLDYFSVHSIPAEVCYVSWQ